MPISGLPQISSCLLVFVKNARSGQVKSRLAESIGDSAALAIYNELLIRVRNILQKKSYDKFIFYSDFIEPKDIFQKDIFEKRLQKGISLGERMKNAFKTAFDLQYKKVVLIGSDIPNLTEQIIVDAFQTLNLVDVVIGPAKDGGYYLIGLKNIHSELFQGVHWSTKEVLNQTIRIAHESNLSIKKMPVLSDLDTIEDLDELEEKEQSQFKEIIRRENPQ